MVGRAGAQMVYLLGFLEGPLIHTGINKKPYLGELPSCMEITIINLHVLCE
jgi:hypothetical protein